MIRTDLNKVNPAELIEHLREAESCEVKLRTSDFGFVLLFEPAPGVSSSISNMEVIAKWAELHRHTISVQYNEAERAISVHLQRLLPNEEYNENEIL